MFNRIKIQPTLNKQGKKSKEDDSISFSPTEQNLQKMFPKSEDVFFDSRNYRPDDPLKITLIGCQGMIDVKLMNDLVIERLNLFFERFPEKRMTKEEVSNSLQLPQLEEVKKKEKMFEDIYSGKLLIFFNEYNYLFSTNIANLPQRKPEETASEIVIKGPRDNFIEDITINIALIRKRLRTNSLHLKKYKVGRRTLTEVALLYIEDIASPEMVADVAKRINNIDVDGIYSGNQFMELIEKSSPLMPRHDYSGRPDYLVQCLLQGRIIIIIDGVAYAMILPINAFFLLKTAEDSENISVFSSFERLLRIAGIFAATLLPGFWVAITTFHQNQIPLIFLSTIVESRRGIPFPTAIEAILMLILFELFKEAGFRIPATAGGTLSVLGALIIGDAAIRAGLTSPAMLVIIAGSSIATFTLVNHSLMGAVSIARLGCILLSSILGMFGFLLTLYFLLIFICNIRILGVPFFGITANLNLRYMIKALIRIPSKLDTSRISPLISNDSTKKE